MRLLIAAIFTAAGCLSAIAAQDFPRIADPALIQTMLSNNINVVSSRNDLLTSKQAVDTQTISNSSFGIKADYRQVFTPSSPQDKSGFNGSLSANVPIIPQLSVSGSLDMDLNGSLALSYSPFASSTQDIKIEQSYNRAVINYNYTLVSAVVSLDKALLDAVRAARNLELQDIAYKLEEKKNQIVKKSYDLGNSSYDDLIASANNLTNKRKSYFNALQTQSTSLKNYYQSIGIIDPLPAVPSASLDDIIELIKQRTALLNSITEKQTPIDQNLELMRMDYIISQKTLDNTPAFLPDLRVSLSTNLPFTAAGASINLTLSPSQLQSEERQTILTQMTLSSKKIASEVFSLNIEIANFKKILEMSLDALNSSLSDLDYSKKQLLETTFLYEKGERTIIEKEQAELVVKQAEYTALQSACELYLSQNEMAQYYKMISVK